MIQNIHPIFSLAITRTSKIADETNLAPLYANAHSAIREVDDDHIIFFEPTIPFSSFPLEKFAETGLKEGPGGFMYSCPLLWYSTNPILTVTPLLPWYFTPPTSLLPNPSSLLKYSSIPHFPTSRNVNGSLCSMAGPYPTTHLTKPRRYNDRQMFSYHDYCFLLTPDGQPEFNKPCNSSDAKLFETRMQDLLKLGVGGFLTEWGALKDGADQFDIIEAHHVTKYASHSQLLHPCFPTQLFHSCIHPSLGDSNHI